jgi:hypothetical protein
MAGSMKELKPDALAAHNGHQYRNENGKDAASR